MNLPVKKTGDHLKRNRPFFIPYIEIFISYTVNISIG